MCIINLSGVLLLCEKLVRGSHSPHVKITYSKFLARFVLVHHNESIKSYKMFRILLYPKKRELAQ